MKNQTWTQKGIKKCTVAPSTGFSEWGTNGDKWGLGADSWLCCADCCRMMWHVATNGNKEDELRCWGDIVPCLWHHASFSFSEKTEGEQRKILHLQGTRLNCLHQCSHGLRKLWGSLLGGWKPSLATHCLWVSPSSGPYCSKGGPWAEQKCSVHTQSSIAYYAAMACVVLVKQPVRVFFEVLSVCLAGCHKSSSGLLYDRRLHTGQR